MVGTEFGLQIPAIADLSDDVAVAITTEDFMAFEDIWVVELFQDIDLREKEFFQFGGLEGI